MLKINLLPPYIYEGAKRRNVMILWGVVLAAVIGGCVFAQVQAMNRANEIKAQTDDIRDEASLAKETQSRADRIRGENQATKAKTDFIASAQEHNGTKYQGAFNNVRDFTISRVLYSSMVPGQGGGSISMVAYAPSLADVGHYLLAMEQNPEVTNVAININSIPGFPQAPVAGGGQQQAAGFGRPGGMSPYGGSMGGPAMGPYGGMSGPGMAPGMMSGPGGGGGAMGSGGMAMMMMRGAMGGAMGPAGIGGTQQQTATPRPPGAAGHDFTITLTLAKPIPGAPTYPPSGTAGGAAPAPAVGGFGGGASPYGGGGAAPSFGGGMGTGAAPYQYPGGGMGGAAAAGPGGSSAGMSSAMGGGGRKDQE